MLEFYFVGDVWFPDLSFISVLLILLTLLTLLIHIDVLRIEVCMVECDISLMGVQHVLDGLLLEEHLVGNIKVYLVDVGDIRHV